MIIEAKLEISDQTIPAEFGVVQIASDGGYDRGFAEGEAAGYEKGNADGYETGYKAGGNGVLSIATGLGYTFDKAELPEGTEIEVYCPNFKKDMSYFARECKGLRKVKLICDDTDGDLDPAAAFMASSVEVLDLSQFKRRPVSVVNCFLGSDIKTIVGDWDFSKLTSTLNFLVNCSTIVDVSFKPQTIKVDLNLSTCRNLSDASVQSVFDGLADLTGGAAMTLKINSSVLQRLTDAQWEAAANKNWSIM